MTRSPRFDHPSFDVDSVTRQGKLKRLHELLVRRHHADAHPLDRARRDIESLLEVAFRDLSTHYAHVKDTAMKALIRLQKEALDFYDHVLHSSDAPDVAHLEKVLRDMDAELAHLARSAEDIAGDLAPATHPGLEPTTKPSAVESGSGATGTPASAKKAQGSTPSHELRAELLKKEKDLTHDRNRAAIQEEAFSRQAGDLTAELEAVRETPSSPHRDAREEHLKKRLEDVEKKETDAQKEIKTIDTKLLEVNKQLKQLAQRGVDPNAGYYRRTEPELVPVKRLDHPPAGWSESAGAEVPTGERMLREEYLGQGEKRVVAAITDERQASQVGEPFEESQMGPPLKAMRTHIDASAAEDFAYKDALSRGEIGIQKPGRINEGGADFITARRNPSSGLIEIVLHDATIDPLKKLDRSQLSWIDEATNAIQKNADGSSRLQLHNEHLEREIRAALKDRRFVVETTLVEVQPNGVRFTPLD